MMSYPANQECNLKRKKRKPQDRKPTSRGEGEGGGRQEEVILNKKTCLQKTDDDGPIRRPHTVGGIET